MAALREAGYTVERAANVTDGLRKLYEVWPDLIIVAKNLLMVNTEDSYLRIRQASYVPIIVMGGKEEATEMLEFGADVYIAKPRNLVELVARVRALLHRKLRHDPPTKDSGPRIDSDPPKGQKGCRLCAIKLRLAEILTGITSRVTNFGRYAQGFQSAASQSPLLLNCYLQTESGWSWTIRHTSNLYCEVGI